MLLVWPLRGQGTLAKTINRGGEIYKNISIVLLNVGVSAQNPPTICTGWYQIAKDEALVDAAEHNEDN